MKKFFIGAAAAIVALASCSKISVVNDDVQQEIGRLLHALKLDDTGTQENKHQHQSVDRAGDRQRNEEADRLP